LAAEQAALQNSLLEADLQQEQQQLQPCAQHDASNADVNSSIIVSGNSSSRFTRSRNGSPVDRVSVDLLHAEDDSKSSSGRVSSSSSSGSSSSSSSESGESSNSSSVPIATAHQNPSESGAAQSSTAAAEPDAPEAAVAYSSFSSIDDEVSAVEVEAAKQAARDKEAAVSAAAAAVAAATDKPWWPPTEFAALLGLAVAFAIAGVSNALMCKPVQLNYRCVWAQHSKQQQHSMHGLQCCHCSQPPMSVLQYTCTQHSAAAAVWFTLTLCCHACIAAPSCSHQRIVRQCSSCCGSPAVQAAHHQYIVRQPQLPLPALPLPLRQQLDLDALPPPSYRVPLLVSLPSAADDGITASLVAAKDWVHGRCGSCSSHKSTTHASFCK
jgi:hypothetical protein